MRDEYLDIAVTPSVHAVQAAMGTDHLWTGARGRHDVAQFTGDEAAFIGARDSFYMATVSETGWPYVQHRGGSPGFLKVVDARTLAFADYRGNKQYVTTGNLAANDKASLFLMDYARQARLKLFVHVETLAPADDPALTALVTDAGYGATIERVFRLHLDAFNWNCPQHITPRFTEAEVNAAVAPLRERLATLEAENAALRQRLIQGTP